MKEQGASRPTTTGDRNLQFLESVSTGLSEGHSPLRGFPRKFVFLRACSQRPLRGSLRGFCGALRGSVGFSEGSDPVLPCQPLPY